MCYKRTFGVYKSPHAEQNYNALAKNYNQKYETTMVSFFLFLSVPLVDLPGTILLRIRANVTK